MQYGIKELEETYKKPSVVDVRSGDTVRVHQKIREGNKERVQIFQGLVIRTKRKDSHTSAIIVRRIASGIGVEKSFLMHSPLVLKVEVIKRSKVHRNYLTYMRRRTGKSARLTGREFDQQSVNAIHDDKAEAEEEKLRALAEIAAQEEAARKAAQAAKEELKAQKALEAHEKKAKEENLNSTEEE
jgi:large subunit ribosomal protein L19